MSKWSESLAWINIIKVLGTIVYSAVTLYAAINGYKGIPANVQEFEDVIKNWHTKAIIDIQLAPTCLSGYEVAYPDQWPGTVAGCYEFPDLDTGSCSSSSSFFPKRDIPAVPAYPLSLWGPTTMICVKRTSEDWATMALVARDRHCPPDYLTCGTSPENIFCTKETVCPVTSMNGLSSFQTGEDMLPLVEMRLTEPAYLSSGPQGSSSFTFTQDRFALLKNNPPITQLSTWTDISKVGERELFTQNGFLDIILSEFSIQKLDIPTSYFGLLTSEYSSSSYFPSSSQSRQWTMIARRAVPWNLSCRDRMQAIIGISGFGSALEKIQLALLIVSCVSFALTTVILPIKKLCYRKAPDDIKKAKDKTKERIELGFQILQLPVQVVAIILTFGTRNVLTSVVNDSCSSPETNALISYLNDAVKSVCDDNAIAIGTWIAKLFLDLLLKAWVRYKEKKYTKVLPA